MKRLIGALAFVLSSLALAQMPSSGTYNGDFECFSNNGLGLSGSAIVSIGEDHFDLDFCRNDERTCDTMRHFDLSAQAVPGFYDVRWRHQVLANPLTCMGDTCLLRTATTDYTLRFLDDQLSLYVVTYGRTTSQCSGALYQGRDLPRL